MMFSFMFKGRYQHYMRMKNILKENNIGGNVLPVNFLNESFIAEAESRPFYYEVICGSQEDITLIRLIYDD